MKKIISIFAIPSDEYIFKPFGSGHINSTYLVKNSKDEPKYILQKINSNVFKEPSIIAKNLAKASDYLAVEHPDYLFLESIKTNEGETFLELENEFWRLSHFVPNSFSINTVETTSQAFDAAYAFGSLTKNLNGLNLDGLKPSIPGFHDLSWRYEQFLEAIESSSEHRKLEVNDQIKFYIGLKSLVNKYTEIQNNSDYPDRLIHHDTKINNVLFSSVTQKQLCVCDLDTLMPGKVISDFGDMMRTYLCEFSEEHTDFEVIKVRVSFFEAIVSGYLNALKGILTKAEIESLVYAGKFMIYMQGLRFLADYLNNDVYYPINYPNHNLDRSLNQIALLKDYISHENDFNIIVEKHFTIS